MLHSCKVSIITWIRRRGFVEDELEDEPSRPPPPAVVELAVVAPEAAAASALRSAVLDAFAGVTGTAAAAAAAGAAAALVDAVVALSFFLLGYCSSGAGQFPSRYPYATSFSMQSSASATSFA